MDRDTREQLDRLLDAVDRLDPNPTSPTDGSTDRYAWQVGHLQGQLESLRTYARSARQALAKVPA